MDCKEKAFACQIYSAVRFKTVDSKRNANVVSNTFSFYPKYLIPDTNYCEACGPDDLPAGRQGFELATYSMFTPYFGLCGPGQIRTGDLFYAIETLYQLSYRPKIYGAMDRLLPRLSRFTRR